MNSKFEKPTSSWQCNIAKSLHQQLIIFPFNHSPVYVGIHSTDHNVVIIEKTLKTTQFEWWSYIFK